MFDCFPVERVFVLDSPLGNEEPRVEVRLYVDIAECQVALGPVQVVGDKLGIDRIDIVLILFERNPKAVVLERKTLLKAPQIVERLDSRKQLGHEFVHGQVCPRCLGGQGRFCFSRPLE